jgi:hypothetical protein
MVLICLVAVVLFMALAVPHIRRALQFPNATSPKPRS